MNELDTKNAEIIYQLVANYFSLESKSLETFKECLFDVNKRFIPENLRNLVGEDLRARFPLENVEDTANLDSGWKLFKSFFTDFLSDYFVTYNNYITNKITINKNELKLFKFIKKYYKEKKEHLARKLNNYRHDDTCYQTTEQCLNKMFELIGEIKPPSEELELVLSFNFADWFLCSTGESWGSCLNLDSDYSSCFWTGLPGLIVDPNRIMIYITNNKKKNFQGIETDRFLTRSWGLISEEEIIHIVRHYPQRLVSSETMNSLVSPSGIKIHHNAMTETDYYFKSNYNYNYENFLYDVYGRTLSIYQDCAGLYVEKKTQEVFLQTGHGGYACLREDKMKSGQNRSIAYEETEFDYSDGLSELISNGRRITDCTSDNQSECCHCGDYYDDDDMTYIDGDAYCNYCIENHFISCERCGEYISNDEAQEGSNNDYYCESCHERLFTSCNECNEVILKSRDDFRHEGESYCEACYIEKVNDCEMCGDTHLVDDLEYVSSIDRTICSDCLSEMEYKKEVVA